MDLGTLLAVGLVLAAVIGWIVTGSRASYEEQLAALGNGDRQGTDRLIEQEQRRTKGLSREAAAKQVLDQLRRDSQ
jgi:hypothetical protein